MGSLYRRTKLDEQTRKRIPVGPWWMKIYDDGKPIYASTGKLEKREAVAVMRKAMTEDFFNVMLKAKEIRDRNYLSCPWVVQIDGKPVRDIDHGWKALV